MKSHGMALYRKELKASRFENVISTSGFAVLILVAYVLAKTGRIPDFVPVGLAFTPFMVWPILAIILGVNSIRSEWTGKTVYLLNTLPVPGWKVMAAKLASIFTGYALTTLIGGISGLVMLETVLKVDLPDLTQFLPLGTLIGMGLLGYLLYTLLNLALVVISQLAYLVSALVERFSWVVFGVVFLTGMWLVGRVGSLIGWAFAWLPPVNLPSINVMNGIVSHENVPFHLAPFLGVAVMVLLLFVGASYIIENEAEV